MSSLRGLAGQGHSPHPLPALGPLPTAVTEPSSVSPSLAPTPAPLALQQGVLDHDGSHWSLLCSAKVPCAPFRTGPCAASWLGKECDPVPAQGSQPSEEDGTGNEWPMVWGRRDEGVSYRWAAPSKASTAGARGKGVQALPDLNKSGAGHTLAKLDAEVTGPQAPAGGQRTAERSLDNEGQPWRVLGGRKVFVLPHPSFLLALARHSSFSHWLTP